MKIKLPFLTMFIGGIFSFSALAFYLPSDVSLIVSCYKSEALLGLRIGNVDFLEMTLNQKLMLRYVPGEFASLYFKFKSAKERKFLGDVMKIESNPCIGNPPGKKYYQISMIDENPFRFYYENFGTCQEDGENNWVRIGTSYVLTIRSSNNSTYRFSGMNRQIFYPSKLECDRSYGRI